MNFQQRNTVSTLDAPIIDWERVMKMAPEIRGNLLAINEATENKEATITKEAYAEYMEALGLKGESFEALNIYRGVVIPEDSEFQLLSEQDLPMDPQTIKDLGAYHSRVINIGRAILHLAHIDNTNYEDDILALAELFSNPEFFRFVVRDIYVTASENEYVILPGTEVSSAVVGLVSAA